MHSKSDNIEIMISNEAEGVIKELFDSLKNRYQNNLEYMKGSDFVFDYVWLLYYKCHKINPNRSGSYIDSPYVSKHNANHEKQVILLIISNRKKQWHYLAIKKFISVIKRNNIKE